jgi:hypothetical protein
MPRTSHADCEAKVGPGRDAAHTGTNRVFRDAVWLYSITRSWCICHKACSGGAEVRLRRVPELLDERMSIERLLHDPALHAFAASVNEAHFAKPCFVRGRDVIGDDRRNVARREGMEVERIFYRNSHVTARTSP